MYYICGFTHACDLFYIVYTGACPGIRKGGGPKSERLFFWGGLFNFFLGGATQKRDEKMIF